MPRPAQWDILTATSWPPQLVTILSNNHARGAQLQGAYLSFLAASFPFLKGYMVAPYPRHGSVDFTIFDDDERPVLYAKLEKDAAQLQYADERVRARFEELLPECPIQTLYGISLVGVMMRTYRVDVATGQVTPVQDDWSLDFRTQEAFEEMKRMVEYITNALESVQ